MSRKVETKKELRAILRAVTCIMYDVGDHIFKLSSRRKVIKFKGEVDLVTQYDRRSQTLLVNRLKRSFPAFGILSEENINLDKESAVRWIIDPLDGTTNFAHNLPIWAISVGLEHDGRIVLGAVYDPSRGELFSAIEGCGAFVNDRRISVSQTRNLKHSLLVTGFPYDVRCSKTNNLNHFANFAVRAQAVRRLGSAALDLCYTACGRFDGYWELKLSPWDQAAGSLILKEAGGRITDFNGRPFDIYGNEVLGTNGRIHQKMMEVLGGE